MMVSRSELDVLNLTAVDVQDLLASGRRTTQQMLDLYVAQILRHNNQGAKLRAVLELTPAPHLSKLAQASDRDRRNKKCPGALHGIPVIVKDNICTPSYPLHTTLGSTAFAHCRGKRENPLIERLRDAGAIILGKGNLMEYGGPKDATDGWSALGGLTSSPYVRGGSDVFDAQSGHSTTMGSSCGPAVAVAAGFAPLAIGTETFGSVVYPASRAAVYGLKGTCGVTSSDGIGKYAVDFDCLGGFAKTAADLGNLMHVVLGRKELKLDQRHDGQWNGMGIGLLIDEKWRLPPERVPRVEEILKAEKSNMRRAVSDIRMAGGRVEYIDMPLPDEMCMEKGWDTLGAFTSHELKAGIRETLAQDLETELDTIEDVIQYDEDHADVEMPYPHFKHTQMKEAANDQMPEATLSQELPLARAEMLRVIDKTLDDAKVDALMTFGDSQLCAVAALAGCPIGNVPCGFADEGANGRAIGMHVLVRPNAENKLLEIMAAWETSCPWTRRPPILIGSRD